MTIDWNSTLEYNQLHFHPIFLEHDMSTSDDLITAILTQLVADLISSVIHIIIAVVFVVVAVIIAVVDVDQVSFVMCQRREN